MMAVSEVCPLVLPLLVVLVFTITHAQFGSSHEGEYETTIDGYRFQFHGDTHLLLILNNNNCYVSDVPPESHLEKILTNRTSRKSAFAKLIPVVEAGLSHNETEMERVHSRYHDPLLRALCFTSRLHQLDITGALDS